MRMNASVASALPQRNLKEFLPKSRCGSSKAGKFLQKVGSLLLRSPSYAISCVEFRRGFILFGAANAGVIFASKQPMIEPGDIISYMEMCRQEGVSLQRG